jgi:hypothetical protein
MIVMRVQLGRGSQTVAHRAPEAARKVSGPLVARHARTAEHGRCTDRTPRRNEHRANSFAPLTLLRSTG